MSSATDSTLRHDWTKDEIQALYQLPFFDLLNQAHQIHRQHFQPNAIQVSTLMSIKTGMCPEDCDYCPQSGHFETDIEKHQLVNVPEIIEKAKQAKKNGATRFCMGGAWRNPPQKVMDDLSKAVKEVKALGMETCLTVGMLNRENAEQLSDAGLDYYNHNIDTSPEYYEKIISTRKFQDRLDTLAEVRRAGINVCCGGIMGMGEEDVDRFEFLRQLATQTPHPGSVPINKLIPVPGTPLENQPEIDPFEFIRVVAVARIIMPKSFVRLSAGRNTMSDEMQAWCFFAGANSIHYGEKLLTTDLPDADKDQNLFKRLNLSTLASEEIEKPSCHAEKV